MRLTVLAGGLGGARFVRGVQLAAPSAEISVVVNTADDIWLHGLRICPDLDTLMYYLGNGLDRERGWGREGETFTVSAELAAYGAKPDWFGLGDRDIATHLIRSQMLEAGYPLSAVTSALCTRWSPGVQLLPMTDDRVETHVVVRREEDPAKAPGHTSEAVAIHFQEWWVRYRAGLPAEDFVLVGVEDAKAGPGVVAAINEADAVLVAPSNPVVSVGPILAVPEIAAAVANTTAPIVGVSGIIGGRPVRGMADACLKAIGVATTASGVALHYGARPEGLLDGWVMDNQDAADADVVRDAGLAVSVTDTLMTDEAAASALAKVTLDLASTLRYQG